MKITLKKGIEVASRKIRIMTDAQLKLQAAMFNKMKVEMDIPEEDDSEFDKMMNDQIETMKKAVAPCDIIFTKKIEDSVCFPETKKVQLNANLECFKVKGDMEKILCLAELIVGFLTINSANISEDENILSETFGMLTSYSQTSLDQCFAIKSEDELVPAIEMFMETVGSATGNMIGNMNKTIF